MGKSSDHSGRCTAKPASTSPPPLRGETPSRWGDSPSALVRFRIPTLPVCSDYETENVNPALPHRRGWSDANDR